jgi:hypothetical protein
MKKLLFLSFSFFLITSGSAQSLIPTVVGSSGASGTSASGNIDWTIGEIMTETFSSGNILTQGFHQPWNSISTSVASQTADDAQVFPNPVTDQVFVQLPEAKGKCIVEIYDAQGRKVYEMEAADQKGNFSVPVSSFPSGVYHLNIYRSENNFKRSFTISKI